MHLSDLIKSCAAEASCLQQSHDEWQDCALVCLHVGREIGPGEVGLQQGVGLGVGVGPLSALHSHVCVDQQPPDCLLLPCKFARVACHQAAELL